METQEIRTFGRRHGKKLSPRKCWLMENLLPRISAKTINPSDKNLILEIGFGNGAHLMELATNNPETIILGAEPFINGVSALMSAMTNEKTNEVLPEYKNIRIYPDDIRLLFKESDLKFAQIWVLHPDPWPKAKHEKRRLLNADFLELLSQNLTDNGQIIIGTDHWGYFDWIIEETRKTGLNASIPDMTTIETKYQQKNKAGTTNPKYLTLSK